MLKFRVWDKKTEEYLADDRLFTFYKIGKTTFEIGNVYEGDENNLIIEQFTGLQDKNGKDIYVGDIVNYHYDGEYIYKGNIVFANLVGKFMVKMLDNNHFDFKEIQTNLELEVIGNINENKEL